ncbi:MAG TPA: hypothetical protein V6D47_13445 [Oscillatoriaceae cyanobacterium]
MTEIAWGLAGLLVGVIGALMPGLPAAQRLVTFVAGLVGGLFGGWLFGNFGAAGVLGLNIWSPLFAFATAVGVLLFLRGLREPHA